MCSAIRFQGLNLKVAEKHMGPWVGFAHWPRKNSDAFRNERQFTPYVFTPSFHVAFVEHERVFVLPNQPINPHTIDEG